MNTQTSKPTPFADAFTEFSEALEEYKNAAVELKYLRSDLVENLLHEKKIKVLSLFNNQLTANQDKT
jgi:hypothetical protein